MFKRKCGRSTSLLDPSSYWFSDYERWQSTAQLALRWRSRQRSSKANRITSLSSALVDAFKAHDMWILSSSLTAYIRRLVETVLFSCFSSLPSLFVLARLLWDRTHLRREIQHNNLAVSVSQKLPVFYLAVLPAILWQFYLKIVIFYDFHTGAREGGGGDYENILYFLTCSILLRSTIPYIIGNNTSVLKNRS